MGYARASDVPILEICDRLGVNLTPAGSELRGLCPIHSEKTPSFYVNPDKNVYICYGCGSGGGPVSLLAEAQGIDRRTARDLIESWFQIKRKHAAEERRKADLLEAVVALARKRKGEALDYLASRGIPSWVAEDFEPGVLPGNYPGKLDFPRKALEEIGLVSGYGRPLFSGRVILPLRTVAGVVAGLSGRALGSSHPKYLTTKGSERFNKKRYLYGLHLAREAVRQTREAFLVEGQVDVMAVRAAGIPQVAAPLGTALGSGHFLRLAGMGVETVILVPDGDQAGLKATMRALPLGRRLGLEMQVAPMPKGSDPASHTAEELRGLLRPMAEHEFWFRLARHYGGKGGWVDWLKQNLPYRSRLNPVLAQLAREVVSQYGISEAEAFEALRGQAARREESKPRAIDPLDHVFAALVTCPSERGLGFAAALLGAVDGNLLEALEQGRFAEIEYDPDAEPCPELITTVREVVREIIRERMAKASEEGDLEAAMRWRKVWNDVKRYGSP